LPTLQKNQAGKHQEEWGFQAQAWQKAAISLLSLREEFLLSNRDPEHLGVSRQKSSLNQQQLMTEAPVFRGE